jgi:hypothetical protein
MGDHDQRIEEILAEWDLDKDGYESLNMSSISLPSTDDTITISASQTSPYTFTGAIGASFPNAVYTATGTTSSPWSYNPSSKITLDGPNADIEINGVSLWTTMQEIANRLNIMHVNPELETQWAELRELGEQYRKLEQQIKEKQATWDRLKAMPAPEVD